jgi:hypothetical protein
MKTKRYFKVLNSSGLPFYSATGSLCKNFDGLVLEYLDIDSLTNQICLKQPEGHSGIVFLDSHNVVEVTKNELCIGDSVFNSPVGSGQITGITDSGYPKVNHIAVARLVHKTEYNEFLVYDPTMSYAKGDWEMFIDDECFPADSVNKSIVIVRSSTEAIEFCKAVKSLPMNIMFDHELGGDDTSMKFIRWMIDVLYSDDQIFSLRKDFKFSVHSQNPVGAENIKSLMNGLIQNQKNSDTILLMSLSKTNFK